MLRLHASFTKMSKESKIELIKTEVTKTELPPFTLREYQQNHFQIAQKEFDTYVAPVLLSDNPLLNNRLLIDDIVHLIIAPYVISNWSPVFVVIYGSCASGKTTTLLQLLADVYAHFDRVFYSDLCIKVPDAFVLANFIKHDDIKKKLLELSQSPLHEKCPPILVVLDDFFMNRFVTVELLNNLKMRNVSVIICIQSLSDTRWTLQSEADVTVLKKFPVHHYLELPHTKNERAEFKELCNNICQDYKSLVIYRQSDRPHSNQLGNQQTYAQIDATIPPPFTMSCTNPINHL